MATPSEIVTGFAAALDAENYQSALSYLAEHCVYDSPTGALTGSTSVVDSYKGNGNEARDRFDFIVYRHEVIPLDDGWFQITFVDELYHRKRSHVFRCNQRVCIDKGKIVRIIHEEIPGQRDRLNEFMQSFG